MAGFASMLEIVNVPAEEEEKQESDHDNCADHPSHPGIPGRLSVASSVTIAIDRASIVGHGVRHLC